ncbi:MAG: D-alanine--D-alanine ligase family protein, partial [Ktedonobacterales bacterium]
MNSKLRVGVVFGGRSGEHEVSVASASSVLDALDKEKYDIVPIGITHEGRWLAGADPRLMIAGAPMEEAAEPSAAITAVTITGDPTRHGLVPSDMRKSALDGPLDIIIPVLHGTNGEDGTLQGLLEMAGMAYAGCGVLGSALGMDKEKAKLVLKSAGLPVVDWLIERRSEVERDPAVVYDRIERRFPYPVFVKPANMGSSVGVGKAHSRQELVAALATALDFDRKALIEPGINCRELEVGVLGNDDPIASVVGEVVSSNEFYDYRAKYIDNASRLII